MKLTKKKVFALALAVCVIAVLSVGSLAWFTDSDEVTNDFLITNSENPSADEIFSVDVWEKTPAEDKDQDGHEYKDILPGDLLLKEAHVENTGYYDQYVRVTVTISDAAAWINALGTDFDVADIFVGYDETMWTHIWNNLYEATEMPSEIVYVLYYKDILPAGEDITVFTNIQIPGEELTREEAVLFGGKFNIKVTADAVQTENVVPENTAAEDVAWAAFQTVEG